MDPRAPASTIPPRIVAGFDGTESGFDAVTLARELAEAFAGELIVGHVYPYDVVTAPSLAAEPVIERELRSAAYETVQQAAPSLEGFERWEAATHASPRPARGLQEIASGQRAVLIVVGSTHRHGLGRVLPGTTAERLLHGGCFPVAVAPAGWRRANRPLRTVGAGFDGSPESAAALSAAAVIAGAVHASLRVISVLDPPDPANPIFAVTSHGYGEILRDRHKLYADRLHEAVAKLDGALDVRAELLEGEPAAVLTAASAELDLLAVGSRGYGALRAVLLGTHSGRLASESRCPLLVVPRGVREPLGSVRPRRRHARTAST